MKKTCITIDKRHSDTPEAIQKLQDHNIFTQFSVQFYCFSLFATREKKEINEVLEIVYELNFYELCY